ncbi:MAG: ferritin family protein [Desulfovibrionaceae bacterium]
MAEFFNATDVIRTAVRMEQRGRELYARAAASAVQPGVQHLFEHLAAEEERHEALFQAMAERVGPVQLPAWSTAPEYLDYLSALLDSHGLFSQEASETAGGRADDLEGAVRLALRFEKDSMLFFKEMRELVPASEREAVDACIAEERSHALALRALLDES